MRVFLFALCLLALAPLALACPFCTALAPSLREEFAQYDYIATAVCEGQSGEGSDQAIHDFRISELLQRPISSPASQQTPVVGRIVQGYSNEQVSSGEQTLMFGIDVDGEIAWSPSEPLSNDAVDYVQSMLVLRESESTAGKTAYRAWLDLFWDNLESPDKWVRADAYNAVAAFSIAELQPWSQRIAATEVMQRISQSRTSKEHRRFYWTILALCGDADDAEFARKSIYGQLKRREKSRFASDRIGLDAAISCFLFLGKERALERIEADFFGGAARHSSEMFAAISALRVHAQEFEAIDQKRIGSTLSLLLDDASLADQVIPDLARLEDWAHVSKLMRLFKDAKNSEQFVRVPIINYLRACPLPEAAAALEQCKTIDPVAYRRANVIFPTPKTAKS
ncbi:MAG: hypothetical protein ACE361_05850 [Aureliella sp.]